MELLVWPGEADYGLPSLDPACLAAMAYARLADGAEGAVRATACADPRGAPHERLPWLRAGGDSLASGVGAVVRCLKQKGFDADAFLPARELADARAYAAMVQGALEEAVQIEWWLEAANRDGLLRPALVSKMPLLHRWLAQRDAMDAAHTRARLKDPAAITAPPSSPLPSERVTGVYASTCTPGADARPMEEIAAQPGGFGREWILAEAIDVMEVLETRLASRTRAGPFLLGEQPCSADAYMFGYLAPVRYVPLPRGRLQAALQGHSRLCRMLDEFRRKYFGKAWDVPAPIPAQRERSAASRASQGSSARATTPGSKADDDEDDRSLRLGRVAAVLVAAISMVGYVLFSGIVRIRPAAPAEIEDEVDDDDGDDDGDE